MQFTAIHGRHPAPRSKEHHGGVQPGRGNESSRTQANSSPSSLRRFLHYNDLSDSPNRGHRGGALPPHLHHPLVDLPLSISWLLRQKEERSIEVLPRLGLRASLTFKQSF